MITLKYSAYRCTSSLFKDCKEGYIYAPFLKQGDTVTVWSYPLVKGEILTLIVDNSIKINDPLTDVVMSYEDGCKIGLDCSGDMVNIIHEEEEEYNAKS